ncbi:MAG: deoxyribose-phosphate aldolase [Rhodothermales bacterium]|nr:deoxyribose-phosphate aldolase [Rhodothermales bacterium]
MDAAEKERIVQRLAARFGSAGDHSVSTSSGAGGYGASPSGRGVDHPEDALRKIVEAGASRFGVRADRPEQTGFDACALAPPLARLIDHTALKPETTEGDIRKLCEEARKYCFASVCINPVYVSLAADLLAGSSVRVCTVIGFPLGASRSETKALEARNAIVDGATELDMVLAVGLLRSERYDLVERDIRSVVGEARKATRPSRGHDVLVKVILETTLLTDEQKVIACVLSQNAGADFVKTSTGFSKGGATVSDVALMRRVVGQTMGVKASGGVRSMQDAETMIRHGASRIGASASVEIVKGLVGESGY